MGARWAWEAICEKGHLYGNFSGGADDCYTCKAPPLVVFEGDDAAAQRDAYVGPGEAYNFTPAEVLARVKVSQDLAEAKRRKNIKAIREYEHLRSFHKCEDHPGDGICRALVRASDTR